MSVYNTIKEEIEKGSYTITEAEETIGNLYARKNITAEQYNDLMDLASKLATHPETGYPYECMTAYDGTVQPDWTIDTPTL